MDSLAFGLKLRNLFEKNNLTTSSYDLSNGLHKRVEFIKLGVQGTHKRPIPNINYPLIYIELKDKTEEFTTACRGGKKLITLNYNIIPAVNVGFGFASDSVTGRDYSDQNVVKLTDNIENMLRDFPQLSITSVNVSNVDSTEYDVMESNDTWNSISKINLTVELLTR